jgi:transcriptional regulator with XRE-family HTH domain
MITAIEVNKRFPLGVGKFLRLIRSSFEMTQKDLARALTEQGPERYCDSRLCQLETGKRSLPTFRFWCQLANFLGMKVSTVMVFVEMLACDDLLAQTQSDLIAIVLKIRRADKMAERKIGQPEGL